MNSPQIKEIRRVNNFTSKGFCHFCCYGTGLQCFVEKKYKFSTRSSKSLFDQCKAYCKENKDLNAKLTVVGKSEEKVLLDINGYEFLIAVNDGVPSIELDDEDDDDAGFGSFIAHMIGFCNNRKRTVEQTLAECVKAFPKHVKEEDDDDDDDDDGLGDEGSDEEYKKWVDEEPVKKPKQTAADYVDQKQFVLPSIAKGAATQRLIADFAAMKVADVKACGFEAAPFEKNLYRWRCKMYPPKDSQVHKDLMSISKKIGIDHILLEILFPNEYPNDPPFIRVLKPRFMLRTGHVTIGGSICMDLLTNSGWSPVNSIESVLIQIRTEMVEGGGRLDTKNTTEYSVEEAKSAFVRVATQHKWKVPDMTALPWHN